MRPSLNFLASVAVASLLFTGCGGKDKDESSSAPAPKPPKKEMPKDLTAPTAGDAAPPPAPDAAAVTAPAQPAAAASTEGEAPSQDVVKTILGALQSYVIANSKNPKDLDELVRSGYLKQIPPAPPGKKIVFDPARLDVKLVNQ